LYEEYYGEMPWLAIPRGDARVATVAKKFEVRGVPRLIVLKPDGTVIDSNGVKKVSSEGPAAIEQYLSA
jgi:nucleoredoxin